MRTQDLSSAPLMVGHAAPDFEACTTHGWIRLHDWNPGAWVVFFSMPVRLDFEAERDALVCATLAEHFSSRGAELLGCSTTGVHEHLNFLWDLKSRTGVEVPFPIVADLNQKVSERYGMAEGSGGGRSLFVLDPQRRVRAMTHLSQSSSDALLEGLRLLDLLQEQASSL